MSEYSVLSIILVSVGYNLLHSLFFQRTDILWGVLFNDVSTFRRGVSGVVDRMSDADVEAALNRYRPEQ